MEMFDFEILLIDENNNSEHFCYFYEEKDKEFILNTWYDDDAGLEGSRFNNDFLLVVLGNLLLNNKRERDIYAGRFKIVSYASDDVGNVYN